MDPYVGSLILAGAVSVIDIASNTVVATVPVGNGPTGVAVNPAGTRAYVANAGSNNVSDPDETLRQMRKGLALYKQLPKKERLLPAPPDPKTDQVSRKFAGVKPPLAP